MASLNYFLLCPFLFLCITSTFAHKVTKSDVGGSNLPLDKPLLVTDNGPEGTVGGRRGVDPIINGVGVGVGVGVGYRPGYGVGPGGHWSGPGFNGPWTGPNSECMLGYVCPSSDRRAYGFYPLASIDRQEVNINWATSKPVETAQYGNSGPHQGPAQHGNYGPRQTPAPSAARQSPPVTADKPPSGV